MTYIIDPDNPDIDRRTGSPPLTTHPTPDNPFPHQQLTQLAPADLQAQLLRRVASLPGVHVTDSCVSVPGARAFRLDRELANGPAGAFQCETEFAHLHPPGDGSLHVTLPEPIRTAVIEAGWSEPHPISGTPLVFGPRNSDELEQVWQIVLGSYRYALGEITAAQP